MRNSRTWLIAGVIAAAGALVGQAGVGAATLRAPAHSLHKTVQATEVDSQYVFAPVTTKIKIGTKVTWKNVSDALHTVTFTTGPFKGGNKLDKQLATGTTLSYTFKKAATYKYRCKFHPGMVGKIVVK